MKHTLSSVALVLGFGLSALFLGGCPRTPDAPEPLTGTPCEQLSDCNEGVSCGAMRLCVDGYCEAGASLMRPCREGGDPVVPPEP
jgi:hypothetical protein